MNKLVKSILLISLLTSSGFSSFAYADDTNLFDKPAVPVEAIDFTAPNEFPVNAWSTGFSFTVNNKTVSVTHGNPVVGIISNGSTEAYYFDEKFVLSQNKVILSNSQYKLLVDNIENSHSRRIRVGTVRSISQSVSRVVYRNENLTNPIITLPDKSSVRVINSVLDGKLRVLTPNGQVGFMDTRTVYIASASLPPNIREINFNTPYIVLVSQNNQNMKVYMRENSGNYKFVRQSKTSTGKPNTPTPNGIFTIKGRGAYFSTNNYGGRAYNYVQFRENHLFHSILYSSPNVIDQSTVRKLGSKDSAGCIRLPVADAKWLNNYVSSGSLVIIDNVERDINTIVKNKNL